MDLKQILTNLEESFNDQNQLKSNCLSISRGIQQGQYTLVEFVENLGHLLVNNVLERRQLGLTIFTKVLEHLPASNLNEQQLQFIFTFYIDRLKDIHVIPQLLDGLLKLLKNHKLPNGIPKRILTELFHNVAVQQQPQQDRYLIFNLFQTLFDKHWEELSSMKFDLIYGIMTSIENERDPRNLMFLFKWMPTFLQNTKLEHLNEEMFEVFACYFPIDFRAPPKDNPDIITRDDLATELSNCVTCTPEFDEFCIALALEKLDSSLEIAKIDSLHLISNGCKTFPTATYMKNAQKIWPKLTEILLKSPNVQIENACLTALDAFIRKISSSDDSKTIFKDIIDSFKGNLIQQSDHFKTSYKIFMCLSKSSLEASTFLTKDILPTIMNVYKISTVIEHKKQLVQLLIELTAAFLVQNSENNDCTEKAIDFLLNSLAEGNELDVIFRGMPSLGLNLTLNMRVRLFHAMQRGIVYSLDEENILFCIKSLARIYSKEINDLLANILQNERKTINFIVRAYRELIDNNYFTSITMQLLIAGLKNPSNLSEFQIYLENLKEIVTSNAKDNQVINNYIIESDVIQVLINFTRNNKENSLMEDIHVIIRNFVGYQSESLQTILLESNSNVVSEFLTNEYEHTRLILLNGFICRLSRRIRIEKWNEIVLKLLAICFVHGNDLELELLANLVNKQSDEVLLSSFLEDSYKTCIGNIEKDENRRNAIKVLSYITKALFMRNYAAAKDWSDLLVSLIEQDGIIGADFKIIMNPNSQSLNEESDCNISILYRQKFFTVTTNYLATNYTAEKMNYLNALASLIEFCPQQVIILQFPKIFKLILSCLEHCKSGQTLYDILTKLNQLIESDDKLFDEYLDEFLRRIINLTTFEDSMGVRIEAIKSVKLFAVHYPFYKLMQHKSIVIKTLGKCIDDKKRIVRKEAVQARSMWYLLDAP